MPVLYKGESLKYWIAHRGLLTRRSWHCGCNTNWIEDEANYLISFGSFGKVALFTAAPLCPKCNDYPWKRLIRVRKEMKA